MQTPDELCIWITKILKLHGWSQREFATRAGLAANMISVILNGHRPTEKTLRALARAANTDEDYVLYIGGYISRNPMQGRNEEIENIADRLEELPERKLRAALPIIIATLDQIEDL